MQLKKWAEILLYTTSFVAGLVGLAATDANNDILSILMILVLVFNSIIIIFYGRDWK